MEYADLKGTAHGQSVASHQEIAVELNRKDPAEKARLEDLLQITFATERVAEPEHRQRPHQRAFDYRNPMRIERSEANLITGIEIRSSLRRIARGFGE